MRSEFPVCALILTDTIISLIVICTQAVRVRMSRDRPSLHLLIMCWSVLTIINCQHIAIWIIILCLALTSLQHLAPPPPDLTYTTQTWGDRWYMEKVVLWKNCIWKNTEMYNTMGKSRRGKKRPLLMLGSYGRTAWEQKTKKLLCPGAHKCPHHNIMKHVTSNRGG